MAETTARRSYDASRRQQHARQTRRRILTVAAEQFLGGYTATTIRTVAANAGVSVATIESLFGTKANLLKQAIDVAIAGDDTPVPVLERAWAAQAALLPDAESFLDAVAAVLTDAQQRSAGLVLAAFEGAQRDADLAALSQQLVNQREGTARWVVTTLAERARLADSRDDAVQTLWLLMDPAVFDRLTRHRGWTPVQYRAWFARSAHRLLIAREEPTP
ncbi:TetR/AcrR family transcriptional regulator [Angustibacter sp. McL0619]|uniref:TetR/AcrR family transcriptional regulator n=1 Tax=Angustibacter sp. McL0619 TaxID=3415676 RepID=UPI003CEC4B76